MLLVPRSVKEMVSVPEPDTTAPVFVPTVLSRQRKVTVDPPLTEKNGSPVADICAHQQFSM